MKKGRNLGIIWLKFGFKKVNFWLRHSVSVVPYTVNYNKISISLGLSKLLSNNSTEVAFNTRY